jgi:hypothetical protein
MRLIHAIAFLIAGTLASPASVLAQSPSTTVPRVISIGGVFTPADGQPAAAVEAVTLAIYAEPEGGAPLWQETQSVAIGEGGRYSVLLGSTTADGIPEFVFATGDAQWLGLTFSRPGEVEGPRMRLTSVPYALRSADADTLGGRPASAYLLAPSGDAGETEAAGTATTPGVTPSAVLPGTTNFLAKYVNSADVGNSTVYDASGFIGVGTTSPFDVMHVRLTNTGGTLTGYAVQNLGNSANSYSGMLFYDHNGALGQFQGFNNSTHEYRINNVASTSGQFDGSINFMVGSSSRFLVNSLGNIGMSTSSPSGALDVARNADVNIYSTSYGGAPSFLGRSSRGTAAAPTATQNQDLLGFFTGGGYGTSSFFTSKGGLAVRAAQNWSDGAQGTYLRFFVTGVGSTVADDVMSISPNGFIGMGTSAQIGNVADRLQVYGDIRVGVSGTDGCVKNFAGNPLAGVCTSDRRFKKDITPFAPVLGRLSALQPVHYSWRADEFPERHFGNGRSYGLIAQDVEAVLPDVVVTREDGTKAVDYSKLPLLTIQAVKELKAENEALAHRVADLERQIATLLSALDRR